MPTLTVYTATFNREKLLPRVYESLKRQTLKDFIWIIIDDGSTDSTNEIVNEWLKCENGFEIQYIYKENGGIHTVRDLAYSICNTELITSLDSDDWFTDTAVEDFITFWKSKAKADDAGIFTRNIFYGNSREAMPFPNIDRCSYQDLAYKYKYKGDKHTILRSEIIKKIKPSPVFDGEKLVGESFKWIQLPNEASFLLLNKPTVIVEYQDTGYSKRSGISIFKNPKGFRANYREHIIHAKYLKPRVKGQIGYIVCCFIIRDNSMIKQSPHPVQTILMLPVGLLAWVYIRLRAKRLRKE